MDFAAGLIHIHAKPLVHRDLKPANVLLTAEGRAKIADVGLARMLHGSRKYMTATSAAGTPLYMSPEQWEEEELTAKSDVYAFGVMLNEMLTCTVPWHGAQSLMGIGRKVTSGARPPITNSAYSHIVMKCWASDPTDRPTMVEVLRDGLEIFKAGP